MKAWRDEHNVSRSHRALQDQTPVECANKHAVKDGIEEVNPVQKTRSPTGLKKGEPARAGETRSPIGGKIGGTPPSLSANPKDLISNRSD